MARITSRFKGFNSRKPKWICPECLTEFKVKTKTCCEGATIIYCASTAEAKRYYDLVIMREAGEIRDLQTQPSYPVVVEGKHITTYRADYSYIDNQTCYLVVEDVKSGSVRDPVYLLKKALVEALYGFEIQEVIK